MHKDGVSAGEKSCNRRKFLAASGVACGTASLAGSLTAEAEEPPTDPAIDRARPGKTPHTRFAVNVEMWFSKLPFLERIRAAADLGFPAIELWGYRDKPLADMAELTEELGLAVTQFTAWGFSAELNNPASDHGRFVAAIRESCDVADQLNCRLFTVVVGNDVPGVSKSEMHEAAIRGFRQAAPICERRDKVMIIEPMNPHDHPGHCLYGSEDAIAICRAVNSTALRINWDLYHMQVVEGDLCRRLRTGFPWVGYLQLADNPGRHEPGTGEINYTRIFQEIEALNYEGYVGLECLPLEDELTAAVRILAADRY